MSTAPLISSDTLGSISSGSTAAYGAEVSAGSTSSSSPSFASISTLQSAGAGAGAGATFQVDARLFAQFLASQGGAAASAPETIILPDGSKYTGPTQNGEPSGRGLLIFPSGDKQGRMRYEGEFVKGVMHGQGKMTWTDSRSYDGYFENGQRNGKGTTRFHSGEYIVGTFKDDALSEGTRFSLTGVKMYDYKDGKVYDCWNFPMDSNVGCCCCFACFCK